MTGRTKRAGADPNRLKPELADTTVELPEGEKVLIFDPSDESWDAYIAADRSTAIDLEDL